MLQLSESEIQETVSIQILEWLELSSTTIAIVWNSKLARNMGQQI